MTCETVRLIDRQTEMDRYLGRQIQFSTEKHVTEIRRIFFFVLTLFIFAFTCFLTDICLVKDLYNYF